MAVPLGDGDLAKFSGNNLSIHAIALACVVTPIAIVFALIKAGAEYFRSSLLMTPMEGTFLMALAGAAVGLGVMVAFRGKQAHWSWWVVALTVGAAVEIAAFAGRTRFGLAQWVPFVVIATYFAWLAWAAVTARRAVKAQAAKAQAAKAKTKAPVSPGMKNLLLGSVLLLDVLMVLKLNGLIGQPWFYTWKFAPVIPLLVATTSLYLALVGKRVLKS